MSKNDDSSFLKYIVGHIVQNNLSDVQDVEFRLNSFYNKFNWVFRSFKNVSIDVFQFLFKSFCLPDYGLSLWNLGDITKKQIFKTFGVAFSNAHKKMLGVPISSSSNAVMEVFNQFLFVHLVTFVQLRYFKRIFNSNNVLLKATNFNIRNGQLFKMLIRRLQDVYGVRMLTNDVDVLRARIQWVQNHEPHTGQSI